MLLQRLSIAVFFAASLAIVVAVLPGCATTGGASKLSAVVDTVSTVDDALLLEVPLVAAAYPNILSPSGMNSLTNANGTGYLDLAKRDIAVLRADIAAGISDPAAAKSLEAIEGYINQGVAAIAPVLTAACGDKAASSQCSDIQNTYRQIVLALPLVELFISNVAPSSKVAQTKMAVTRAAAVPSRGQPVQTPSEAVAALKHRLGR